MGLFHGQSGHPYSLTAEVESVLELVQGPFHHILGQRQDGLLACTINPAGE